MHGGPTASTEWRKAGPFVKPLPSITVDSDQRKKDVGFHFEKAFVLLSNDFRYFGRKGTDALQGAIPEDPKVDRRVDTGTSSLSF